MAKPRVLILGGSGFIGRNLVAYLYENQLVSKIRIADKVLPQVAGLSQKEEKIFSDASVVEFKQAGLSNPSSIKRVFTDDGGKFNFVINLAGETKYSQTPEVYKENIFNISTKCAQAAQEAGVDRFIEVSTTQVYDSGKKPSTEADKVKPWTKMGQAKLDAEEALRKITGLPVVFVRPAIVYGPADIGGIMPRVITAAVYKELGEKMEFLWDASMKINTVHVRDVCKALWHLCTNGEVGEVYNLADKNDTDQGKVNELLEKMFGIKTGFMGNMKSKLATKIAMKTVAETANDKHLKPWSELLKKAQIVNSPLTPYLDEELLYNNPLAVDGSKIEKTGFTYDHPTMTVELLTEQVKYFIDNNSFPPGLIA